ncbi:CBASS cGAMP synthase [Novosphingobium naphthalenivorans]|uniref:CBASS cGAMP synthase n=1 Tax=Novosphingobium naphthalenivorans TaxID=273168 RepID=UPI00082EBE3C|nr:hypothetical protein [Novosphingobium naphthalenivorans]
MTLANAHPIFVGLRNDPSYLASLNIDEQEQTRLINARTTIRKALRDASWKLEQQTRFWRDSYLIETSHRVRDSVAVKFLTQGSFAYKTLNTPAKPEVQEIDLDDGMYVPVRFMKDSHPALAAGALFTFVEETLKPVCIANGWELELQNPKNTCVRVRLWKGAHVDIPIYSVPEERFEAMQQAILEKAIASTSFNFDSIPSLVRIPSHLIMLAQRDGHWVQSDPKQLHDWVEGRVERYGPIFRRLCRFFKGWRDHTWVNSKLSSICLMCAIDAALIELGGAPANDRDDREILRVAKLLPGILDGQINNPVVPDSCLNGWSDTDKKEIISGAQALANEMESALERTGNAEIVITRLRNAFGERIPYRPDIITIDNSSAESVRAAPAIIVPTPKIIDSSSG